MAQSCVLFSGTAVERNNAGITIYVETKKSPINQLFMIYQGAKLGISEE